MKYFGFLARFVVIPLIIIRLLLWWDKRSHNPPPPELQNWPEEDVLLGHIAVAVAYTTPWDNYLVATNVWSYDRNLVTGLRLGWVPIEEYTFFVLQSALTGSWLQYLSRRIPADPPTSQTYPLARLIVTGALGSMWLASMRSMISGTPSNTYRDLILGWALPPVMLQVGFGGDILWRNRRLILTSILSSTAYLGATDSIAIRSGTWSITPAKTIEQEVIPGLPFEELLFFFMTNVLLSFGVTLVQSKQSESRLPALLREPYNKFKSQWLQNRSKT